MAQKHQITVKQSIFTRKTVSFTEYHSFYVSHTFNVPRSA